MLTLAERYRLAVEEVARAALSSGRDPAEVKLVAVSKEVGLDVVEEAVEVAHMTDLAENRTSVMLPKIEAFPGVTWHFIGNIQSRQVRNIVGHVSLIHSVDRADIIPKLEKQAASLDIVQDILLEVNVSGELSKSGFEPDEVATAVAEAPSFPHLHICGFMTMAPRSDEPVARAIRVRNA